MARSRRRSVVAVAALAALVAVLVTAAVALAARPAGRAERAELTRLIHHDHSEIAHPGRVHVRKIIVSTKAPWASAELATYFRGEKGADLADALARRTDGHYRIVRIGSDAVGCGLVSNAVSIELGLGKCP